MTNKQQLMDLQKQKRLDRSKILLNAMKHGTQAGEIVFSDEKMFTLEAKLNSQNNRILAKNVNSISPSLKTVFCRQKPASVMVWAAISESWRSFLIFVKEGFWEERIVASFITGPEPSGLLCVVHLGEGNSKKLPRSTMGKNSPRNVLCRSKEFQM